MSSVFERTIKDVVKEVGGKELMPVKSISDATKIRPFSVLWNKPAQPLFWGQPDVPLGISLMHILEPSPSVPDTTVTAPLRIKNDVVQKQMAGVSVNAGPELSFSVETTKDQGSSHEYWIVTIPYETLEDLPKRKRLDPEPSILKQCRKAKRNLYVVTETVELLNNPTLCDCSSVNAGAKFSYLNKIFKIGGKGEVLRKREKCVTLKKGMALAYKRKQLVFTTGGWEILHVADNEKQKTFADELQFKGLSRKDHMMTEVSPIGRTPVPFWLDFQCLQEEVSGKEQLVQDNLSKNLQDAVLSSIRAVLGDREALQDLMGLLDQEPVGHLNGSAGAVLDELRKDSTSQQAMKHLVLYLLEAIMVLSDIQHDLLAQSLERKILAPQRDLVRSILEPNFRYPWSIPFTLQLQLLAPLRGEALAITRDLLEECGLKIELHGHRSTWDLEAKKPLSALYGTLSVLQRLAGA